MKADTKNVDTLEQAAVYAVSQDQALTRLRAEKEAMLAKKRYTEAHSMDVAMAILHRLEIHVISQTEWRETRWK